MAYFNGKKVYFGSKIVMGGGGIDKETLETAINEKTETISAYTPVVTTDFSSQAPHLNRTVIVTEDIAKNGLYILRIAEPKGDSEGFIQTPYLMYGQDADHLYNENVSPNPNIGEVSSNVIPENGLSVGSVIGFSQPFEKDGFVWVTISNVQCVTKENLDNILITL